MCMEDEGDVHDGEIQFGPGYYDFSSPEQLPQKAKERVQQLLESGRLFRYQGQDDVAMLEKEFAEYLQVPHVIACNSGGCGIFLGLRALGVQPGDSVLVNSFTLAPVPGAIVHAGAKPVFVTCRPDTLSLDTEDLHTKANSSGAKVLILSYMRGHVPDLDVVLREANRLGLMILEDCAHTLGAKYRLHGDDQHRHLGTFGAVGVWSLQTNKTINAGEGGIIATSRQDLASQITIATGSYGHYHMHGASGDADHLMQTYPMVPNCSMRMTTIAAALARPQLAELEPRFKGWEQNGLLLREKLGSSPHVELVKKSRAISGQEVVVWSSVQFRLPNFSEGMIADFQARMAERGVPLAWFGGPCKGFTATLRDWKFADPDGKQWASCQEVYLAKLLDIPLYHTTRWGTAVIDRLGDLLLEQLSDVGALAPHVDDDQHPSCV